MGCGGSKDDAVDQQTYSAYGNAGGGPMIVEEVPVTPAEEAIPEANDNEYGHDDSKSHSKSTSALSSSEQTSASSDSAKSRDVLVSRNLLPSENMNSAVFRQVGGGGVDFRASLREAGDRLVLILFFEEKCEECEAMNKLYQEFVLKYPGVLFLEANVAHNKDAVSQLRIKFLPTFIAFKNHLEVGRLINTNLEQIEDLVQKNI